MTILVHRNVNVSELLSIYNDGLDPEDHYSAAHVLCIDHMGEAWDDWPDGCETHLVTYVGHILNPDGTANVYLRIAPHYPAWDIDAYIAAYPNVERMPHDERLPANLDYSMLGSDGR